jgi:hypothetical protein
MSVGVFFEQKINRNWHFGNYPLYVCVFCHMLHTHTHTLMFTHKHTILKTVEHVSFLFVATYSLKRKK